MIKPYECTQCGGTDFEQAGGKRVRCTHCGSLFEVVTDEPTLLIEKGANVKFLKGSNVEVRGDVEIEGGANVEMDGKLTLLKGGKKQKFELKLIQPGDKNPST